MPSPRSSESNHYRTRGDTSKYLRVLQLKSVGVRYMTATMKTCYHNEKNQHRILFFLFAFGAFFSVARSHVKLRVKPLVTKPCVICDQDQHPEMAGDAPGPGRNFWPDFRVLCVQCVQCVLCVQCVQCVQCVHLATWPSAQRPAIILQYPAGWQGIVPCKTGKMSRPRQHLFFHTEPTLSAETRVTKRLDQMHVVWFLF
jgi:hypothetical protein